VTHPHPYIARPTAIPLSKVTAGWNGGAQQVTGLSVVLVDRAVPVLSADWNAVLLPEPDAVPVLVTVATRESVTGKPPPFEQAPRISTPAATDRKQATSVRPGFIFTLVEELRRVAFMVGGISSIGMISIMVVACGAQSPCP
jgi:hypothetical protein